MAVTAIVDIKTSPPHHIEVADSLSAGVSIPVWQWGTQTDCIVGKDDLNAQPVSTMFLPPAAGEQMALSSDSNEDKPGGKGIATVMIHYIDGAGNEQTEVVTLNGTTPVMTAATNIQFVNILHSDTPGGAGNPDDLCAAGLIMIYSVTNPAKVYCCIEAGKNIDDSSQFMVPAGKIFAIENYGFSASDDEAVQINLRANTELGLSMPKGMWFDLASIVIKNGVVYKQLDIPLLIGPLGIVKGTAFSKRPGATVNCSYTGDLLPVVPITA